MLQAVPPTCVTSCPHSRGLATGPSLIQAASPKSLSRSLSSSGSIRTAARESSGQQHREGRSHHILKTNPECNPSFSPTATLLMPSWAYPSF
jgi:hypothetical protein